MYTITLSDGTKLKNLELNGNNYISDVVLDNAVFEGKLGTVKISDGETEETFTDMVLMSNRVDGGKSWFVLGEKTEQQKQMEHITQTFTDVEVALAEVYEMILGGM
jgi:hypothetical protein